MRNRPHTPSSLRELAGLAVLWLWFIWCDYAHILKPVLAVMATAAAIWAYCALEHVFGRSQ